MSLEAIAALLGHRSMDMTLVYDTAAKGSTVTPPTWWWRSWLGADRSSVGHNR
jgi:hypothetical protein